MAGRFQKLRSGEYRLEVAAGEGPAGVRRANGPDLAFDVDGGWRTFQVRDREQVYFWWRGEHRHPGVALGRVSRSGAVDERAERRRDQRRIERDVSPPGRERRMA